MNAMDLRNAFDPISGMVHDNFTVLLLRLIAKGDSVNQDKLRQGFPVEVKAVEIYKTDCPYTESRDVDWKKLAELAYWHR